MLGPRDKHRGDEWRDRALYPALGPRFRVSLTRSRNDGTTCTTWHPHRRLRRDLCSRGGAHPLSNSSSRTAQPIRDPAPGVWKRANAVRYRHPWASPKDPLASQHAQWWPGKKTAPQDGQPVDPRVRPEGDEWRDRALGPALGSGFRARLRRPGMTEAEKCANREQRDGRYEP